MNLMTSYISVVITCYSEGSLIFEAVSSVLNQSLPAKDLILVNDGSTDSETLKVCHQLEQESKIQVIWQEPNGGPAIARNRGFAAATGDVFVLLDADDLLPQTALEQIQTEFDQHPETGFIYGNYIRQNQPDSVGNLVDPGDISLQTMLSPKPFSLSSQWKLIGTTPIRRSLWESLGGYDPKFGVEDLHDVEFWMRAIASGCPYYHLPEPIYIWRKYLGQNSGKVTLLAWYRIVQKHLKIYQQVGLEWRAYELLLLGSKWLNQTLEIKEYSNKLIQFLKHGEIHFSTLIALAMPTNLLRWLAKRAARQR
jgi:glycosyltransferase involved in cell wall biosynthesis